MKRKENSQRIDVQVVAEDLYEKSPKIYPRKITGPFQRLRIISVWALLGLYYGLPWLRWNAHQAILFDLPARKFYIFGLIIWPQDFVLLSWLLIIAALTLFFATALAGRLWCGYACPQTVWTEIFVWIERFFEGDRNQQIRLDKQPWSKNKLLRKIGKHFSWLIFALFTGFTFVGYFTPIEVLTRNIFIWQLGPWETFWIFFYSLATWGNAGFLREQICKYMCPYARFQGAMFDRDTLVISYDEQRGESRGSRKKNSAYKAEGLGDCIDCELCVQVCPTGIDIRDGLQMECIACAACVDACDSVMVKMNYPKGLVHYTTEETDQGHRTHIIRPRTIMYFVLWVTMIAAFSITVATRIPLRLDVIRDRHRLYQENSAGMIENVYTLKILNMDNRAHRYRLIATGLKGLTLIGPHEINVSSGEVRSVPLRLSVDPGYLKITSSAIMFNITALDNPDYSVRSSSRFIGPALGR